MEIIDILNIILVVLVFIIFALVIIYLAVVYRNRNNPKSNEKGTAASSSEYTSSVAGGLPKEAITKFMEFDEIKDNMIIRKNRAQYIMILQCQGVNYDLMSEEEKIAVEQGFVQFLNTLRFPIQLYVQTRSLNLKDIIDGYKDRVRNLRTDVENLQAKMQEAKLQKNNNLYERLRYEVRRKENVLEYGADIAEYIGRMSLNKNVLQQKTYVIVSYYAAENGSLANYSKEEIDDMCFQELFTRSQSVMRSLAASEVTGKILNSEELAELLYIAYNRDDSELLQLSKALDAQYDSLYNTAKDVLKKKEERLEEQINAEAVELATNSIVAADQRRERELENEARKKAKVKEKALELVEEYKTQMDEDLYERTKDEINGNVEELDDDEDEEIEEPQKKKRGRKKKTEAETQTA
ncbi:MAG: hypothetical protein IJ223_00510 [Clostridia bacterium]|nr:hypothetical protein [Clostridia bacterium]